MDESGICDWLTEIIEDPFDDDNSITAAPALSA
jgi:hypothetical protein